MTTIRLTAASVMICLAVLSLRPVMAETHVTFTGNLVVSPCTVNNNSMLVVDFSTVNIADLVNAGTAYALTNVSIPLDCPGSTGALTMMVSGPVPDGLNTADGAIQTSKEGEGLVVYLRQSDERTPVPLNESVDIRHLVTGSGNSLNLLLRAGLGRKATSSLTAGNFTAAANLLVAYQ